MLQQTGSAHRQHMTQTRAEVKLTEDLGQFLLPLDEHAADRDVFPLEERT